MALQLFDLQDLSAAVMAAAPNGTEAINNAVVTYLNRCAVHVIGTQKPFIMSLFADELHGVKYVQQQASAWQRGPMQRAVFEVEVPFQRRGRGGRMEEGTRKEEINCAKLWLKHQNSRCVDNVTFAPPPHQTPDRLFNLYVGPGVSRERALAEGDVARAECMVRHIRQRWCGGDETVFRWVMGWLASVVQRPGHKLHSALVVHGPRAPA